MKNVFAYRDAAPEGGVFLSRSPEGGLAARKKASDKEAERFGRQAMLPIVWQSVFLLVFCVGLLLLTVGLDLLTEEDFKGNETIGVVLAAVGGGLFAVGLLVIAVGAIKRKRVTGSSAFVFFESEREKLMREVKEALAIPAEAVKCDVFGCRCKTVRNRQKRKPFFKNSYFAFETEGWREGEAFCIFDGNAVYKFPYANIIETERVEKRITFFGWNKREKYNHGKYKPYKIRYNHNGDWYTVKPCYRVRLFRESDEFEILFPAYERETLEKLTGKTLP